MKINTFSLLCLPRAEGAPKASFFLETASNRTKIVATYGIYGLLYLTTQIISE